MFSHYSELNFGLDDELNMLREQVNAFAASEIAPRCRDRSQQRVPQRFVEEVWRYGAVRDYRA